MSQQQPGADAGDFLLKAVVLIVGSAAVGNWLVGNLAAVLGRGRLLQAGIGPALGALVKLPKHLHDPRLAWPPKPAANLPGPIVYWLSAAIVVAAILGGTAAVVTFVGGHENSRSAITRIRV